MSDIEQAIALVQRTGPEALSVDQILQLHHNGQLRPMPGEGRRLQVIGSVPGYTDEPITVHVAIAAELVRRGVATYA